MRPQRRRGKQATNQSNSENRGALEKRQSMEIGKRSSDFIILSVSCLYSVHRPNLESHLPNVILTPSQTAATKPVTMIVITALKV